MKILCAISGIEFTCTHFPATLHARELAHPVFSIQQHKLLSYAGRWSAGELTPTDSYLLFLALLNSTDLIEWRVPVHRTAQTDATIAQNMEYLFRLLGVMSCLKNPSSVFTHFVVSPDTKTLENVKHWLDVWKNNISEFQSGYANEIRRDRVRRREAALDTLIRKHLDQPANYAGSLAEWAELAGEFPTSLTLVDGAQVPLNVYWKNIIRRCCRDESIFSIPTSDLAELIEHCSCQIEQGSLYSHALMSLLRKGAEKQKNYLGLGDLDISSSTYKILDTDTSVEDANKQALIDSAPETAPRIENYPSRLAYLRAKLKYDMATEYKKRLPPKDTGAHDL